MSAEDWLNHSALFHEAAWRVINCEPARQRRLHAPTLHLLGHGYETLLKASYVNSGAQLPRTHDLWKLLWSSEPCRGVRALASEASAHCSVYANTREWIEDNVATDALSTFEAHFKALSDLHSNVTNYRLRYPDPTNPMVPVPLALHCVLGRLIDSCATRWQFRLISPRRFRAQPF